LHEGLSAVLLSIEIAPERREELLAALRLVWEKEHEDNARFVATLRTRLEDLVRSKKDVVLAIATGKVTELDGEAVLADLNHDIDSVESEITAAEDIERDFVEFVEFTLGFVDDLQRDWWDLDKKHLLWCKQLLFPEGFSVSRAGEVYTPKVSEFYRLATNKKDSEEPSFTQMVTPRGFEPRLPG
jgi:hypothetical protein